MFLVHAHLKEIDLKAIVESNLFTRYAPVFHPEASGRHTGISLKSRMCDISPANVYVITSHIKILAKTSYQHA